MRLEIHKVAQDYLPRKKLHSLFERVVARESGRGRKGTVSLVFTTDEEIQVLNREFRSIDRPTDVLSFNLDEPDSDESVFGEIYIATPTARRQASSYRGTVTNEFLRLFCHGLLHLFGYDHMNERDAGRMKEREEHYLATPQ
ncbi:MAG: rRNA maturation RNase YbeY [candidate division Zixibacteria bacterium]|nr:rRNA maturation RNase YbeY [candidate division Zixibacteria bacterium]